METRGYLNKDINTCFDLRKVSNIHEMDSALKFQLTASTLASICCGASLTFWLLSIKAMSLQRLRNQKLITSQAVIGTFAFLGSIASILLALLEAPPKDSNSRNPLALKSSLQLEVGSVLLLLILNEVRSAVQTKTNTDLLQVPECF